jgi:RNA polymerase sigma-70 factor (ECF subfamily)
VSNGNHPGWCEALYHSKSSELILYGRALGLSHGEAEDVLQETFLALLTRDSAPERADHYCVRAYRNRALNYRRSLWRRLTREWESLRWFEKDNNESAGEVAAMRCLASLPADQREVVVLKIWHQHTFEEIAELVGVSPNTVAGRYRYALQKLRKHLEHRHHERNEEFGDALALLDATPSISEN